MPMIKHIKQDGSDVNLDYDCSLVHMGTILAENELIIPKTCGNVALVSFDYRVLDFGTWEWPKREKASHVNFSFNSRVWKFDMWEWRKRKKMSDTKCKFKHSKWIFDMWKWPWRKKEKTCPRAKPVLDWDQEYFGRNYVSEEIELLIDEKDAVGTRACSVCEDDEKEQTLHKVPTFTQNRSFGSSGSSGIGSGEKIELLSDMADVLGDKGMQDKGMSPSAVVEGQTKMKAVFTEHGVSTFTPLKGLFIQGLVFVSFFLASMKWGVPSSNRGVIVLDTTIVLDTIVLGSTGRFGGHISVVNVGRNCPENYMVGVCNLGELTEIDGFLGDSRVITVLAAINSPDDALDLGLSRPGRFACFERGASITRMYSQITLAEIAAQLQVGSELLVNVLEPSIGSLINDRLEGGQLYTPAYVARVNAGVRWAARGITVPMHLSALGSSLKLLLQEMNDVPFDHLKLMGMLLSSCMKT
ncbi:E3 UFM1-protein ligase 1 [Tanacetum coccineum]|uniref:E3 UFM1-protein ligase 1 n=1 Tax=Tanacetum coccineum TaxID=301880 RepID=A0ABQ5GH43_9ASTR